MRAAAVVALLLVLPAEGYHSDEALTLLAARHSKHAKHQKIQTHHKVHRSLPNKAAVKSSVAHITERHAALGATLKYLTAHEVGPDGKAGTKERRKIGGSAGIPHYPGLWEDGAWSDSPVDGTREWTAALPTEDGQADLPLVKERSEWWGDRANKNNKKNNDKGADKKKEEEEEDKLKPETKKHREEREKAVGSKGSGHARTGGLSRCGFSWDDAAAKVGERCLFDDDCWRPLDATEEGWSESTNYSCFDDMPDYQRGDSGECSSMQPAHHPDSWCQQVCGAYVGAWCDPDLCKCVKNSLAWNKSAPIQAPSEHGKASQLPPKNDNLLKTVAKDYDDTPSGLPACPWRPQKGCTNDTQYECFEGNSAGQCSSTNWFSKNDGQWDGECQRSCVHVRLLNPTPYYALWIPGPEASPCEPGERLPGYEHNEKKMTPERRGIRMSSSEVLMSNICHSEAIKFVGITMYSPMYQQKAARLVRSCERVGVCCKATLLPADSFGPSAPEGSEKFRFETISMKPSFILSQIESTELPVATLVAHAPHAWSQPKEPSTQAQ